MKKDDKCTTVSLKRFSGDVGIPVNLHTDMGQSFVCKHTGFQKLVGKYHTRLDHQEAGRKNQIYKLDLEVLELRKAGIGL